MLKKIFIYLIILIIAIYIGYLIGDKDCAYFTESECRGSINGYLRTYAWIDSWAKNCEKEGKIFTVDKREEGVFLDPRCAVEKKEE